ncbi:MAG: hypothetical protein PUC29_03515 [Clostridia bacterium]|nr:hypothetical protein [Clostridia bacterium]
MKKLISALLILSLLMTAVSLAGCGTTKECEYDSFIDTLKGADTVTACIYGDEEVYYDLDVTDEFTELFNGEFVKSDFKNGNKLLTVTVSMQYEICFFEDGCAMIYYGFCGVFDSDRQYYSYKLDGGINALTEYILSNGTISEQEDK